MKTPILMTAFGTTTMAAETIGEIFKQGFKKARLIPFMLVAGAHFQEDLIGDEDSWKTGLEKKEISVSVQTRGLGFNKTIIDIFCSHIQDALDVIPDSTAPPFKHYSG